MLETSIYGYLVNMRTRAKREVLKIVVQVVISYHFQSLPEVIAIIFFPFWPLATPNFL